MARILLLFVKQSKLKMDFNIKQSHSNILQTIQSFKLRQDDLLKELELLKRQNQFFIIVAIILGAFFVLEKLTDVFTSNQTSESADDTPRSLDETLSLLD